MPETPKLAVAVIGAGAFGRNHARVYHDLGQRGEPLILAAVVDSNRSRADEVAAEFGSRPFSSLAELLDRTRVDCASIAVPTSNHAAIARTLMNAGVDVLIEKPLASTLAEADELIRVARDTGRIAQVGHLERFNPAVQAAVPIVTQPMFFEVHRLSTFGPRALDVDVVLDLMIHDLDIVLSFVNSPVREVRAVGLPILSGKVDIANVRMEFESGCVANFTASRVSTERVRKLRFFQPRQYVSIDYSRQDVLVISIDPKAIAQRAEAGGFRLEDIPRAISDTAKKAVGIPPGLRIDKPAVSQEEPLKAELKSFLDAVRRRATPLVSLEDGRRSLAAALQILDAVAAHAQRAHLAATDLGSGP